MTEYLREVRSDSLSDRYGTYTEVWECEPPPMDVRYRVLEDEWSADYSERRIKRILIPSREEDERTDEERFHDMIAYGACPRCGSARRSLVRFHGIDVLLALNCPTCGDTP